MEETSEEENLCNITLESGKYSGEKCTSEKGTCKHSRQPTRREKGEVLGDEEEEYNIFGREVPICGERTKKGEACQNVRGKCHHKVPSRNSLPLKPQRKKRVRGKVTPNLIDDENRKENSTNSSPSPKKQQTQLKQLRLQEEQTNTSTGTRTTSKECRESRERNLNKSWSLNKSSDSTNSENKHSREKNCRRMTRCASVFDCRGSQMPGK